MNSISFTYIQPLSIRWFYWFEKSTDKNTQQEKSKYKIYYNLAPWDICVYLVSTTQRYEDAVSVFIKFDNSHLEKGKTRLLKENYISISKHNQAFDFHHISECKSLLSCNKQEYIWMLTEIKFKEISDAIQNSRDAKRNLQEAGRRACETLGIDDAYFTKPQQDFIEKYLIK